MPKLRVLNGPAAGQVHVVAAGATVGRAAECTVVLGDASISRRHASLERDAAGWLVRDEGSRNGLWAEEARVQELRLADGAEFRLGEVRLRFVADAAERESVPAAAIELEEIVLDDEPLAPAAPRAAAAPQAPLRDTAAPAPAPVLRQQAPAAGRPAERASAAATRGILQYKKVEQREGLAASDLSQLPGWLKLVAALLALALFAAVFWTAFRGTAWLKGEPQPAAEAEQQPQDG